MKTNLNKTYKEYNKEAKLYAKYVDENVDLADTGAWGGQPMLQQSLIKSYEGYHGNAWGLAYLKDCKRI